MAAEIRLQLLVLLPLITAALILLFGRRPQLREAVQLVLGSIVFGVAVSLAAGVFAGGRPEVTWGEWVPGFAIVLRLEPLGMLFALVASGLWVVTTTYSMGYLRAQREVHQTRFFVCFAVAICAALGAAVAGNLLTLFMFYEVMTISTYPLVTHHGTDAARRGGRTYLSLLMGTSLAFFLTAIVWTWQIADTLEFVPGGILADAFARGRISRSALVGLLALYAFGVGKAALMPFHRWLPAAMVAPAPVSALLHAVAVVKVGVFTLLKIVIYVFGLELLQATTVSQWLIYLAGTTVLVASLIAMTQDNLKARLAYSTVSQLAYITLGAALATPDAIIGAGMHIAMHAVGKITLFFCAGAIYVKTHKTEVSQMRGLGRQMPWTMGAFLLGSLSIIGLPPCGGVWSKWLLASGAAAAEQPWLVAVLMLSSLLNVLYLVPIPIAGFFLPPGGLGRADCGELERPAGRLAWREAPLLCVVPLCLTALGTVVLFLLANQIYQVLAPLGGLIGV